MSNLNNVTNKFFSNTTTNDINNTKDIANTINTNSTKGKTTAEKSAVQKESFYNLSIRFSKDLEQPMKDEAWRLRTSITQYLNELVRNDLLSKGYLSNSED